MSCRVIPKDCCVAGCPRPAEDDGLHPDEALCAEHAHVCSPALVGRLRTIARRREALARFWDDETLYDAVIASGRYLKLCDATQVALEQADAAWMSAKLDILIHEGQRRDIAAEQRPRSGSWS